MTDRRSPTPLTCDEARDLAAGFVLGALAPDEMVAVREHLATCAEAHPEFEELGGVVPYLADSLEPVEPPAALGSRILAAITAEAAGGSVVEPTSAAAPVPTPAAPVERAAATATPTPAVVDLSAERARRRSPLVWIAGIAAVLLIVGLGAWNVALRQDLGTAQAYAAAVDEVLALAGTTGGQAAILAPDVAGGPSGIAAVGADGQVKLALRGLAATSGSQVYEAWVIGPDPATPVAIGSFTPDAQGFGTLATTTTSGAAGVTIALTLEPTAGRTSPTPPVISSGVAAGST
ncbi:MAG TPA: anti-sigma factor [Patescibacteria group bacterium]|nr:anti-sigma factor [Patescibacteria group bacterium]